MELTKAIFVYNETVCVEYGVGCSFEFEASFPEVFKTVSKLEVIRSVADDVRAENNDEFCVFKDAIGVFDEDGRAISEPLDELTDVDLETATKEEEDPGGGNELAGVECPNGRVAFDRRACEVDSVLVVKLDITCK